MAIRNVEKFMFGHLQIAFINQNKKYNSLMTFYSKALIYIKPSLRIGSWKEAFSKFTVTTVKQ